MARGLEAMGGGLEAMAGRREAMRVPAPKHAD